MPRVQVSDLRTDNTLRPQARPVDTFVTPGVPKPDLNTPLAGLADALKTINPTIQNFLKQEQEEINDDELKKGMVRYEENREEWNRRIKNGTIPEGLSPWTRQGVLQGSARLNAREYDQALRQAWAESGVRNTDDPEALSQFTAEFSKQWMEENLGGIPETVVGEFVVPKMRASLDNLRSQHAAQRVAAFEKQALDNLGREVGGAIEDSLATTGDIPSTAGAITSLLDSYIRNGMGKKKANDAAIDAVIDYAELSGNTAILNVLAHVKTPGGALSKTAYGVDKIANARRSIVAEQMRKENHEYQQSERARTAGERQAADGYLSFIRESGLDATTPAEFARENGLNADQLRVVKLIDDALMSSDARVVTNREALGEEYILMQANPANYDYTRIWAGVKRGDWSRDDAEKMNDNLNSFQRFEKDEFGGSPTYRTFRTALSNAITRGGINSPIYDGSKAIEASDAVSELDLRMSAWREKNPEATLDEFLSRSRAVQREIATYYREQGIFGDASQPPVAIPPRTTEQPAKPQNRFNQFR